MPSRRIGTSLETGNLWGCYLKADACSRHSECLDELAVDRAQLRLPLDRRSVMAGLPDVDARPAKRIRLRLAQDFARHGRRVALTERQKLQHIGDRISLGPSEVGVR